MAIESSDSLHTAQPILRKTHLLILLALAFTACCAFSSSSWLVNRLRHMDRVHNRFEAERLASSARFRGVLAMETVANGQHDILLATVDSASGLVRNITDSPANETSPAWSPDGQWLAYLSDSSGKNEVYARGYPRGERIQVTHQSEIAWEGPLYWMVGPDYGYGSGVWIMLKGRRRIPDPSGQVVEQTAVYRIPMTDVNHQPEIIRSTIGISGAYRIADDFNEIIFEAPTGRLQGANLDTNRAQAVTLPDEARGMQLVPGSFTWLLPRGQFAYLTQGDAPVGEVGIEIRRGDLQPEDPRMRSFDTLEARAGDGGNRFFLSGRVNSVRGILAAFGYSLLALQDGQLDGIGADGCPKIHLYNMYFEPVAPDQPPLFNSLCVDLPPQGFIPNHLLFVPNNGHSFNANWVVLTGRAPDEKKSAIYGAFVFVNHDLANLSQIERLPVTLPSPVIPGTISVRDTSHLPEGIINLGDLWVDQ